ncbi:SDR family oxidoreductase [Bacillus massilinigeriensis]|uniref:SDR family oxidoreductase n=1 Tax=Bacillus mediterraneensis TaxID=1805474 RepID=UPI0008F907D3|nr:SDR family oxidoreductase [Bacillus mediterraneensis]
MAKKTALITGGSTGIGKQIAYSFAKAGVNTVINYRKSEEEALLLARNLTESYGTRNIALAGDVSIYNNCSKLVEQALEEFGSIEIFVHNAGPYIHERKRMGEYSLEEWKYLIDGNLNSMFYLSSMLLPIMREQRWGRVITIGYDRVETVPGWIYRSAFAAAKAGLASLTRTVALEEADHGITSNMVCPGDIVSQWKEKDIASAVNEIDKASPVGRPGTGEDIARVISFLADEKSDFLTGGIIPVTGGKDVLGKAR